LSRTLAFGFTGALICSTLILLSLPSQLFGRVPRLAGSLAADAPLVAVVDGQTLRLRENVIRLQGLVAPGRGLACRNASGATYDCGAAAAAALASIVRDHAVICRLDGRDNFGFAQGRCDAAGVDVNRAMVAAGWARADPAGIASTQASYAPQESRARAEHRGVWRDGGNASF
jgi:endonuclease YncB( thermonuclease family)